MGSSTNYDELCSKVSELEDSIERVEEKLLGVTLEKMETKKSNKLLVSPPRKRRWLRKALTIAAIFALGWSIDLWSGGVANMGSSLMNWWNGPLNYRTGEFRAYYHCSECLLTTVEEPNNFGNGPKICRNCGKQEIAGVSAREVYRFWSGENAAQLKDGRVIVTPGVDFPETFMIDGNLTNRAALIAVKQVTAVAQE
jgi:hypothetical protein